MSWKILKDAKDSSNSFSRSVKKGMSQNTERDGDRNAHLIADTREPKKCKDYFLLAPKENTMLTYFDNVMIIVITYSCIATMYTIGFNVKI